jgi:uncharacterized protein YacL
MERAMNRIGTIYLNLLGLVVVAVLLSKAIVFSTISAIITSLLVIVAFIIAFFSIPARVWSCDPFYHLIHRAQLLHAVAGGFSARGTHLIA